MYIEHGKDDRRDRIAGDGEGEHGDERSSDARVVGGLAGDDSFHRAFTEGNGGILYQSFRLAVGDEGCTGPSCAWQGSMKTPITP